MLPPPISTGNVASATEGGYTTSYAYDTKGVLNSVGYPRGAGERQVNNDVGAPTTIIDPLGRQTTIAHYKRWEVISQTTKKFPVADATAMPFPN